jgi:pimeloyl-ACP methyl ester carboxylesterase
MTVPSAGIVPFYFGTPERPLYGCFHEPRGKPGRNCAVVLCNPLGHEYINSHRALRQLAARLSDAGFPVLRFDYFGCGDSSGYIEEGGIQEWLDNISQAISEIRRRTGLSNLCLGGLRLGASLSLLAAADRDDIRSLVLWDPVVKGREYLEGLLSFHKIMLRFRLKPKEDEKSEWPMDILGYPLTRVLFKEIETIDLLESCKKPADNVLIMQTEQTGHQNELKEFLNRSGAGVDLQRADAPQIWLPTDDGSLLVPAPVLQAVTAWISRVHL